MMHHGIFRKWCESLASSISAVAHSHFCFALQLPVVVEKINSELEGVVDVEVEWTGLDLQGSVGEHLIAARVTRLATATMGANTSEITIDDFGRELYTQCYHVSFDILDIDECRLPVHHFMHHQCHSSAICVNTIGAYECVCPRMDDDRKSLLDSSATPNFWRGLAAQQRSPWELSLATSHYCPNQASTYGCCPSLGMTKADFAQCRNGFYCPVDPCKSHDCGDVPTCVRKDNPIDRPNYICQCPEGLMGNGRRCLPSDPKPEPKVKYDGKTPTELTVQNNYYCGCTKPIVDQCDGFPPCKEKHQVCTIMPDKSPRCACRKGYFPHETYGCVDESPPNLTLKHDPNRDHTLRLKQGDFYKEHGVEIKDENAEEYLRSLKIAYSQPIPNGCLTQIGEFHVNYTIATPWTVPTFQRVTRRVMIDDIDECLIDVQHYQRTCPSLIPRCDTEAGARCVNTIGSYTCKCPIHTTGDGFHKGVSFDQLNAPEGFRGGQSCHDTGKPVIELQGPNPKIFRVCGCGGLSGIIINQDFEQNTGLKASQQARYESELLSLVQMTKGAELCATPSNSSPKASDCCIAYDETYKGRVDLSEKVVVGKPVQKSPTEWSVPYDVKDDAGNEAVTVWRDIVVEEVDLAEAEDRIRKEVMQEKQREIDAAVSKALAKSGSARKVAHGGKPCPDCPPCDCSGNAKVVVSSCENVCPSNDQGFSNPSLSTIISPFVALTGNFAFKHAGTMALGAIVVLAGLGGCVLLFLCFCSRPLYDIHNGQMINDPDSYPHDRFDSTAPSTPRYSEPHPNMFNNDMFRNGTSGEPYPNIFNGSGERSMNGRTPSSARQEVTVNSVFLRSPQRIISPNRSGDGIHTRV